MDGWMDRKKQMNGGKDKKDRCIVGWMAGYKIIYIYIYIWMVGRKDINMKKMMECWMDRKIYEKQKDGWMEKNMYGSKEKWMDG